MTVVRNAELTRPWRGKSPVERVAERREQLLDAALEVFAGRSYHAAKVRDVCRAAGLSERYFYESFGGKEQLLAALADRLVSDFVAAASPHIPLVAVDFEAGLQGALEAVVDSLTEDPRRARILFVEVVGVSAQLEDKRRAVIGSLVDLIRHGAAEAFGPWVLTSAEVELIARSVIGAAAELLVAHVRGELELSRDELTLNLTRLFLRARPVLAAMADEPQTITATP